MSAAVLVLILACYDGDTCTADREILPGRDRVRIANIDAPEIHGRCPLEIVQALQARDFVRALIVGKEVQLTQIKADYYPRRVDALVSFGGTDVGQAEIAAGLARPWTGHREPWCAP